MKIIVCIKQVPSTNKVEVDPVTGVLNRNGIETKMNPYDLYAVETAMRLKEQYGGTVKAVTMGPPQAETVLREAFSLGVDEGYLLTDRAFAGADVLATSRAISQTVGLMGDYDVIICGKQSTDGDTAQVGPEMSEWLDLPLVTNVKEIVDVSENNMTVKRESPTAVEELKISLPCLISVEKDISIPRLPSYLKKKATADREIHTYMLKDLEDKDASHYGLTGSPTQVQRIFPPEVNNDRELWNGNSDELADRIYNKLDKFKLL